MPQLSVASGVVKYDGVTITTINNGVLTLGAVPFSALPAGSAANDVLTWDGSAWAPATPASGSVQTGYVNLTPAGDSFVTATVTGLTWVTAASVLGAFVMTHPTGASAEEAAAEGCVATIGNIVAGTGFDVYLNIPGGGLGPYRVGYIGG